MKRVFVGMPPFEREWRRLELGDTCRRSLEQALLRDPNSGALIKETGGVRKIRHAIPGKGKSGSIRVFYYDYAPIEHLFLMAVIKKGEVENLNPLERKMLGAAVTTIIKDYENRKRSKK